MDKAVRRDGLHTAPRDGFIKTHPCPGGTWALLRKAGLEAAVYRFVWDLLGASEPGGISSLVTGLLLLSGPERMRGEDRRHPVSALWAQRCVGTALSFPAGLT